MARTKSVASPDYPEGIIVPLTPEEEAEADAREIEHNQETIARAWQKLRARRNDLLRETDSAILRQREQTELGIERQLAADKYLALLQYRQQLRDLPAVTVDPEKPTWPRSPV